jgi:AP-3 complex subunit delta-1
MFERTLTDVVKGIRASKRDTALYISQCIAEIKTEINSNDLYVKANALQKLTFLQMLGYSMNWASFATIEVMSSTRFGQKRIGYLAASQGFTQDTEVILLTTNLLKKELRGAVGGGMHGVYEAGLAINCISNIVTEDLALDLLPEITSLTAHPQPYLRKKAILCLFKVFMKYPQALRLTFEKLQQALNDPNPSVVSCAVNVITELSDKNPKNYLHLAPAFFELLTGTSNNWMLIKVVKLLGSLVPEEPRLARKLLEPLATIVRNTQAKSLLYEAVLTITLCLPYCRKNDGSMPANVPDIVELCANTLGSFLEESDQNLKFLGLVGFASLMVSHPKILSTSDYRPMILACLSDQDETIRRRALDLLIGMTTRKNIIELVSQLMKHVQFASGTYRSDLVAKIVELCSAEKYSLLTDFAWYIDVLFQLGHLRGIEAHGDLLRFQITDIALRVLPIRAYAVRRSIESLLEVDGNGTDDPRGDNGRGKNIMPRILPALAWIIGEYSDLITEAIETDDKIQLSFDSSSNGAYHSLVQLLTCPTGIQKPPTNALKVYVQASMKIFSAATADPQVSEAELEACLKTIMTNLQIFAQCTDIEVSERSFTALALLGSVKSSTSVSLPGLVSLAERDPGATSDLLGLQGNQAPRLSNVLSSVGEISGLLNYLFKPSPMKPVGNKAQRKQRTVLNGHSLDIDASVDESIFGDLITEEEECRSGSTLDIESVSFTQQHPLQNEASHVTKIPAELSQHVLLATGPVLSCHGNPISFQHTALDAQTTLVKATNKQRHNDPFYLASAPSTHANNVTESNSRFGTIQLVDSDDEEEKNVRRKHRKKRKQKTSQQGEPGLFPCASHTEGTLLSLRSGEGLDSSETMLIHSSDEDNDDDTAAASLRKKGASKAFSGLARVDLTTPLRDDEIIPQQQHRVVPHRQMETKSPSKPHKKAKKAKKTKHQRENLVEDLLDLGGFGTSTPAESQMTFAALIASSSATAAISPANTDLINSAFDDLLGLPLPAASIQSTPTQQSSRAISSHSYPWLRATIKAQNASGPKTVDWSQTSLTYRVHKGIDDVSVVFRFENRSMSAVGGLALKVKDHHDVQLGNLARDTALETKLIGPFRCSFESSNDVKGSLSTSDGGRVPFKFSIPVSIQLTPQNNLTLDDIYQDLNSMDWVSHSSKVEIVSDATSNEAVQTVAKFLSAGTVAGGTASATTFAAKSINGTPLLVLLKITGRTAKVDVKSTSHSLCKDVATDFKRILL